MRSVLTLLFLAASIIPISAGAAGGPASACGHPALQAIEGALQAGEISQEDALLYRLYFLKDFEKLPDRFRLEGDPLKCGTPILLDVYEKAEQMPARIRDIVEGYRNRPYLPESRETEHFVIHYQIGGTDGVPNEAWVDVVEQACEDTWTTYHATMNWDAPPGDGAMGGGVNKIDCYIHDLGTGLLGLAEPENQVSGGRPYDFTGYFHVDNGISSINTRMVTTSHEYMHVTQFGYYGYSTFSWYMENCAMMGEEWVYDTINEYTDYLNCFFNYPYRSVKTHNGCYEYGAITWPMYESERFSPETVESIWDLASWSGNIFTAHDDGLDPYGYDLHSAVREYRRWTFYTNTRDDGQHFTEGGMWINMLYPNMSFSSYPTGEQHPHYAMKPEALGTSIMRFLPDAGSSDNMLTVDFNGPDCTHAVDFIAKLDGQDIYMESYMVLDGNGDGQIQISSFDNMEYVFMLASMRRECNTAQDYAFSADTGQGGVGVEEEASGLVRVWPGRPNPFAENTAVAYAMPRAGRVEIVIVDASGRVVRDLFEGDQAAGRYEVMWDGRDDSGRDAGGGVYFARVVVNGEAETGKLILAR